uniref:Uncharacterized protein n=1 Tax=Oryza barthii TaxID=65489 RepID=A0A0D3F4T1_9ORYZ
MEPPLSTPRAVAAVCPSRHRRRLARARRSHLALPRLFGLLLPCSHWDREEGETGSAHPAAPPPRARAEQPVSLVPYSRRDGEEGEGGSICADTVSPAPSAPSCLRRLAKDFRKVHLSMLPLQRRSSSRGSSHQHAGPDDQCQSHVLTVPFYHQLVSRSEVVEVEVNGLRQKSSADKRMQVVGDVYLDESISMKAYLLVC